MRPTCHYSRFIAFLTVACAAHAVADDWPRFRGPNGSGIAPALDLPNEWSEDDYGWQVDLPGVGHSSPVVLGKSLFITSGDVDSALVYLDCYDPASGTRNWRRSFSSPKSSLHGFNCLASTTPAADDQHVYLSWATPEQVMLVALTHEGDEVWRRELGPFGSGHGFAASPIVVGDLVCLQGDTSEGGYLIALDTKTGDTRWKSPRPAGKESYATPALINLPGIGQAIVVESQTAGIAAIDPQSGDSIWQTRALPARTVSSAAVSNDWILATCGSGGNGHELLAVRVTAAGGHEVAYSLTKNVPYVPTPVVVGDLVFLWHDRGTVTCIELATGDNVWTKRVGGKFFGSPVAIGDRLLAMSTSGEAVMLAASRDYQLLGRTDLGEPTQATPAIAGGRLFLRTESKLMCLEE